MSETLHMCGVYHFKTPVGGSVTAGSSTGVYQDGRLFIGKSIFMQASPVGCCQTHIHAIVGQLHGIETRFHTFKIMVKSCEQMLAICFP